MQLPKGKSLYEILELNKDEVRKDNTIVKKAYRKLALRYHPDKQPMSPSSSNNATADTTQQFQLVGYAYSILNDDSKRQHYDLTGGLDEHDLAFFAHAQMAPTGQTWTKYYMDMMQDVVNEETVRTHASKYKGSAEEEQDVLEHYVKQKGNMNNILSYVLHSKAVDVPRFMNIINTALNAKKVAPFPAYARTTTRSAQYRRLRKDQKEAEQMEQQKQGGDTSKTNKGKQAQEQQPANANHEDDVVVEDIVETISIGQDQPSDDVEPRVEVSSIGQDQKAGEMGKTLADAIDNAVKQHEGSKSNVEKTGIQEDETTSNMKDGDGTTGIESANPLNPTKESSSHKRDSAASGSNEKQPTRTITTRSMTRTMNQQTQTTAKSPQGSVKTTKSKKTVVTTKSKKHKTTNKGKQGRTNDTKASTSTPSTPVQKSKKRPFETSNKKQQEDGADLATNGSTDESPTQSRPTKRTKRILEKSVPVMRRLRPRQS